MSTRTSHPSAMATTSASGPALSTARRTGRTDTGIMLNPAEVALLRVSAKPGVEGNELILCSGITVPLTYAEAVAIRENLLRVEKFAVNDPTFRNGLFEIVS
ncbi:hypothetical protein [Roseimicrobium sp. ORNL1]|uniref:hypothetical protein n=1 Tax=Roseimicrobium sp. ORNL1 TaxID=2711231 RepID=UPI0013E0F20F|nr:hypothetical protein [Roseimicrobium sp. ORNL1]QIF02003.1 hypothetical protein G5S37_10820 [Roseimicrobium sp. ORNL1]